MELFSLGGKKHISTKPYTNRCLWSISFKAEASTYPQISVLKDQMCKYTLLACTPHCGASAGSWQPGMGLITWRNSAACGKSPVRGPGSQEHGWHGGQEMPCMVPVLLGITVAGAGHIRALTPVFVSWDILPETSLMPHSMLPSLIWHLHIANPCPAAEGWCVSTCPPGITGGISLGSRHLLLGCAVSHQLPALPFLVWAQADTVLLQHSSGAPHCLFWRPGTKFVRQTQHYCH